VIYVATIHYKSSKWIDVQLGYLRRHITESLKTFAVLDGIDEQHHAQFDRVVPAKGGHEGRLNLLAAEISAQAKPDDIIMFLDGDAFPIADPMPAVHDALATTSLLAVRRDEANGDKQPHPCFCAISVGEWARLQGDWSTGYQWRTNSGIAMSDVGGNLLGCLERTGSSWTPLLRTNTRNDHPLWFGVYGSLIYHHGSGFRPPLSRVDLEALPPGLRGSGRPVVGPIVDRLNEYRRERQVRAIQKRYERVGDRWFELLRRDPHFYERLIDGGTGDRDDDANSPCIRDSQQMSQEGSEVGSRDA
jgi:hypothetical protein